jgi:hypothetical protein
VVADILIAVADILIVVADILIAAADILIAVAEILIAAADILFAVAEILIATAVILIVIADILIAVADILMLDAASLMPKRSINNTGAKVYKSDTTVKGNLSRDASQQLIPVSFRPVHFHCEPQTRLYNDPHHHVYSTQQQMTRQ